MLPIFQIYNIPLEVATEQNIEFRKQLKNAKAIFKEIGNDPVRTKEFAHSLQDTINNVKEILHSTVDVSDNYETSLEQMEQITRSSKKAYRKIKMGRNASKLAFELLESYSDIPGIDLVQKLTEYKQERLVEVRSAKKAYKISLLTNSQSSKEKKREAKHLKRLACQASAAVKIAMNIINESQSPYQSDEQLAQARESIAEKELQTKHAKESATNYQASLASIRERVSKLLKQEDRMRNTLNDFEKIRKRILNLSTNGSIVPPSHEHKFAGSLA